MYDYYVVQEDDLMINTKNLQYYFLWSKRFEDENMNYIPSFIDYEVFRHHNSFRQRSYYLHNQIGVWTADMFLYHSTLMLYFERPQHRFTIFTNTMLRYMSSRDEWFGDENLKFNEPNVHYHGLWASRHYRSVVPWTSFNRALTHHSSDKYITQHYFEGLNQNSSKPHHNPLISLDEYKAVVNWFFPTHALLHKHNHLPPWNLTVVIKHKIAEDYTLPEDCITKGRASRVAAFYHDKYSTDLSRSSTVSLVQYGLCTELSKLKRQDLEKCLNGGNHCQPEEYITLPNS